MGYEAGIIILVVASAQTQCQSNEPTENERRNAMNYALIQPLIALVAGISILLQPRILSYLVAFYLIAIGVLGLLAL